MIAMQIRPCRVETVPDASEWEGDAGDQIIRSLLGGDSISAQLRSEMGSASSQWTEMEGLKPSVKLRQITCEERPKPVDRTVGKLLVLVLRSAATISFLIAGMSALFSIVLLQTRVFMPLLATVTMAVAFFCAGWAQRVIGKRISLALHQHS